MYKDQLLSQLTTEELLKVVPRTLITPRTFSLQPFQTLFIAGLARLDVVHSRQNVMLTVFASRYLPIHVVYTQEASRFYNFFRDLSSCCALWFTERLNLFPPLVPKEIDLRGISWTESCADVVLSSVGWVSVTMGEAEECVLKAYTPDGRGVFVRQPALLPFAVNMKGRRVIGTPCYQAKVLTVNDLIDEKDFNSKRLFDHREERNYKNSYKSFRYKANDNGQPQDFGWHEVDQQDSPEKRK